MSVKNGINGWAGTILRVNLTTGSITKEDTLPKYRPYIGGMGIGYKVIWDEVPLDTDPLGPDAKCVFGVGPLTASGVPCSGRMNITLLSCWSLGYSIIDAHMGGHIAHAFKYAGYDAMIVEGQSDHPVYIKIEDENVTIDPSATAAAAESALCWAARSARASRSAAPALSRSPVPWKSVSCPTT